MLEIDNGGMTPDEYLTHMMLCAMSSAPLMIDHDLRQTSTAARKSLANRAVIAIDQDTGDVHGRSVHTVGTISIWVRPLADGTVAVALFKCGMQETAIDLCATTPG